MYIHSSFKFINQQEPIKYYKGLLKEISKVNTRRTNKFTVLSLYGALNCIDGIKYGLKTNTFIASQYGVISGVLKVAESLNDEHQIVMPFDFLNINGNNAGFIISETLNISNQNHLITSNELSFEKTVQLAFHKSKDDIEFEALIGGVDESVKNIPNYKDYIIHNELESCDGSCWIYCSNKKENSIAKIDEVKEFNSKKDLDSYISNNTFSKIEYNHIYKTTEDIEYNPSKFYGTQSASEIIDLIRSDDTNSLFVSKNTNGVYLTIKIIS